MKLPRLSIELEPDDRVGVLGLLSVSAGASGQWGWAVGALVFGALLLVAYAIRELRG